MSDFTANPTCPSYASNVTFLITITITIELSIIHCLSVVFYNTVEKKVRFNIPPHYI